MNSSCSNSFVSVKKVIIVCDKHDLILRFKILIFFLFIVSLSSAQKIDSLLRVASESKGIEKLLVLSNACKHAYTAEENKTDSLASLLRKEAENQRNTYYIGQSYYFKGLYAFSSSNLDSAYTNYRTALGYFKEVDSLKQVAEMHHNLSLVYFRFNKTKEAQEELDKAIVLNTKLGNTENLIKNKLVEAGNITDENQATSLYKEIILLSEKVDYHEGILICYLNMGILSSRLGEHHQNLKYLKLAEEQLIYPENQRYTYNILSSKASAYYYLNDYANAEKCYAEIIDYILNREKIGDFSFTTLKINSYYNLAETKKTRGDYKGAAEYFKLYADQNDSLGLVRQAQVVASAESKFKLDLKETENALLKKETEIKESELSTAKRQKILLGLLLFTAFIAILLLTARYNTKQQHFKEVESINLQIENQNKSLNQLNSELEGVLQVVSHDLRTPLAKIKMLGELVQVNEKSNISEDSFAKLRRIDSSIGEAEGLISSILELREHYNGSSHHEPEAYHFVESLEMLLKQYQEPISLKNLNVIQNHQGDTTVILDKKIVNRILANVISNAIKFTDKEKSVWIESSVENHVLTMKVKDQGPGFDQEDKQKLFVKFAKLSNAPKMWGTSHGLGLFITKKLVDQLNGTIEIDSEHGVGSEISINLPFEDVV